MNTGDKPKTLTEAAAPEATEHLKEKQKAALDVLAEAEHATGPKRERLTREVERLGDSKISVVRKPKP